MAEGGMDGGMAGMPMPPPSPPSSSTPMAMAPGAPQMGMGGMHMTFFWGKDVQVLFSGWPGRRHGVGPYFLALLFVFALSVLVESLSYTVGRLATVHRRRRGVGTAQLASASSPTPSMSVGVAQTAVHAVRVGLAYVVMLAVMSFNVGVLIAAVAGHALGFFLFGSRAVGWGPTDGPAGEVAHTRTDRPSSGDK